jgi:cell division protein FtsL
MYTLLRSTVRPAANARGAVIGLVIAAVGLTSLGIAKVRYRHEIVALGFELSTATEQRRVLDEHHRKLELERATLADPQRIRAMATALGMVSVPPDSIRVIAAPAASAAPAAPQTATNDHPAGGAR